VNEQILRRACMGHIALSAPGEEEFFSRFGVLFKDSHAFA
jgi:hypothetical protein